MDHTSVCAKFIVTSRKESKILEIYAKEGKLLSIHAIPTLPPLLSHPPYDSVYGISFGICCVGKIFVMLKQTAYEFNFEKNCWLRISSPRHLDQCSLCCISPYHDSAGCVIGNNILITGWCSSDVELLQVKNRDTSSYSWTKCKTKLPANINRHTATNIENNKVILVGGRHKYAGDKSGKVLEGTLSIDGKDVQWKWLPSSFRARTKHVAFKLKDVLVVAGGYINARQSLSCEIYDIKGIV